MSFDFPFPQSLKTPSVNHWADISTCSYANDIELHGAFHQLPLGHTDLHGRSFRKNHTFAGMGSEPKEAQISCFMEMIERASATSGEVMSRLSYITDHCIHWSNFFPYTQEQIENIDALRSNWPTYGVDGTGLLSRQRYTLPAEAVFPWWRSYFATATVLPECEGSGIAAGRDHEYERIIHSALYESLERDALMLSWRVPNWPVRPIDNELIPENTREWLTSSNLQFTLYDIGDEKLCPVIMAILSNTDNRGVTIGASCGRGFEIDASKALSEAIMLQDSAKHMNILESIQGESIYNSHDHVLWAYQNGKQVTDWYANQASRSTPREYSSKNSILEDCYQVFGEEPILVDISDSEFADYGYRVVRVLQPHAFKKEYVHENMYLGGKRLNTLMSKQDCDNKQHEIHRTPHPIG